MEGDEVRYLPHPSLHFLEETSAANEKMKKKINEFLISFNAAFLVSVINSPFFTKKIKEGRKEAHLCKK